MPPVKESPSVLPEFLIAFVLPNAARAPTEDEIEEVRQQTVRFWGKQLEHEFSKPFIRLELKVSKSHFGERKGEDKLDLAGDFNMYLEMSGQAVFNGKFRGLPSGDEVFREMVSGDSMDYLVAFVRGIKTANIFGTALEVTARRIKYEAAIPGGTVICPSFFVAFALDQDDPEAKIPDGALPDDLVEQWKIRTHKAMEDNLRKEWPDTFESFDLDTTIADKGTKKPDERFHVYMENEASAKFSSSPPSPEDVFRVLMKSASTEGTVYLLSMHDMEGTPFSCVTTVTIQLVGMEMPQVEELPPPEKEQEPEDEGSGEEEDGGEEEQDIVTMNVPIFLALVVNVEPPAEPPKDEELLQFKDLMLRFFYTTIKKEYPHLKHMELKDENVQFGAGLPEERFNMCVEYNAELKFKNDEEIPDQKTIQKMVVEINLSSILAHVKNLEPLCFKHATEVTMRQRRRQKDEVPIVVDSVFEAAVDPPPLLMPPALPEPKASEVKALPAPKKEKHKPEKSKSEKKSEEARKKAEVAKEKAKKEARRRAKEDAKRKAEEEAQKKAEEETRQKVEEEAEARKKGEEEARRKAEEEARKKAEEEARRKAEKEAEKAGEEARKKAEEEARKTAEEETRKKSEEEEAPATPVKKEKKKAKKATIPPASPKPKRPEGPVDSVQSSDIYVAIKLDNWTGPPTDDQLEQLRKNTAEYFSSRLRDEYPKIFVSLDLSIAVKVFGVEEAQQYVGVQDYDGMNVYIEWITEAEFRPDDTPSSPSKRVIGSSRRSILIDGLPSPYELTRAIVRDCDILKYLLEHVRIIEDSDFTSATACHIQQRIEGKGSKVNVDEN